MPISYTIDHKKKLVITRLWDAVTEDQVYEHNRLLRSDPAFDPSHKQLTDMTELGEVLVGTGMIKDTARDHFFLPGVARALVAPSDVVYGMARMFAIHSESMGQKIEVFRELGVLVTPRLVEPMDCCQIPREAERYSDHTRSPVCRTMAQAVLAQTVIMRRRSIGTK